MGDTRITVAEVTFLSPACRDEIGKPVEGERAALSDACDIEQVCIARLELQRMLDGIERGCAVISGDARSIIQCMRDSTALTAAKTLQTTCVSQERTARAALHARIVRSAVREQRTPILVQKIITAHPEYAQALTAPWCEYHELRDVCVNELALVTHTYSAALTACLATVEQLTDTSLEVERCGVLAVQQGYRQLFSYDARGNSSAFALHSIASYCNHMDDSPLRIDPATCALAVLWNNHQSAITAENAELHAAHSAQVLALKEVLQSVIRDNGDDTPETDALQTVLTQHEAKTPISRSDRMAETDYTAADYLSRQKAVGEKVVKILTAAVQRFKGAGLPSSPFPDKGPPQR